MHQLKYRFTNKIYIHKQVEVNVMSVTNNIDNAEMYQNLQFLSDKTDKKNGFAVRTQTGFKFIEYGGLLDRIVKTIYYALQRLGVDAKFRTDLKVQNIQISQQINHYAKLWMSLDLDPQVDPAKYFQFYDQFYTQLPDKVSALWLCHKIGIQQLLPLKYDKDNVSKWISDKYEGASIQGMSDIEKVQLLHKMVKDKGSKPKNSAERNEAKNAIHHVYASAGKIESSQLDVLEKELYTNFINVLKIQGTIHKFFRTDLANSMEAIDQVKNLESPKELNQLLDAITILVRSRSICEKLPDNSKKTCNAIDAFLKVAAEKLTHLQPSLEPGIPRYVERREKLAPLFELLKQTGDDPSTHASTQPIRAILEQADSLDCPAGLEASRQQLAAHIQRVSSESSTAQTQMQEFQNMADAKEKECSSLRDELHGNTQKINNMRSNVRNILTKGQHIKSDVADDTIFSLNFIKIIPKKITHYENQLETLRYENCNMDSNYINTINQLRQYLDDSYRCVEGKYIVINSEGKSKKIDVKDINNQDISQQIESLINYIGRKIEPEKATKMLQALMSNHASIQDLIKKRDAMVSKEAMEMAHGKNDEAIDQLKTDIKCIREVGEQIGSILDLENASIAKCKQLQELQEAWSQAEENKRLQQQLSEQKLQEATLASQLVAKFDSYVGPVFS